MYWCFTKCVQWMFIILMAEKITVKFKKPRNIKSETDFFTTGLLRAFNFANFHERF